MKNALEYLQNLKFSQYEAKAYYSLLQQGNVTGYELAKNSGIPASKIYQVLNKLIAREVALALDGEPLRYMPVPPREVLGRYKGDLLNTINNLEDNLNEVYQKKYDDNYIWNISGRTAILNKIKEGVVEAQRSIFMSFWDEEADELRDVLVDADARGVALSIVHYGQSWLGVGREYRHGREHKIRQQRGARRIAIELDDEKVILGHFIDAGGSNALWTSNKGLVLLAKDYIIHDIYTIRMAEKFGDDANEIFELN